MDPKEPLKLWFVQCRRGDRMAMVTASEFRAECVRSFSELFSIETESWESAHATVTALAVGDATAATFARMTLSDEEFGAAEEFNADALSSIADGGEQLATIQDSAKPVTINALRIWYSI